MIQDGKIIPTIMKEFSMNEISIVDHPAQADAKIVLAKRSEDVEKRMALTTLTAGHAHLIVGMMASPDGLGELRAGQTSYADGHSHSWVMDDAGNIILADAEGHSHGLAVLVKADTLTEEQLASLETVPFEASKAAEAIGNSGETSMSDQNDQAVDPAVEALKSQLAKAERLASLNDAEKAHLNGLEDGEAFLALDADARAEELAKAADANAVVFKSLDGTEYRKNDDPRLIALAKASDAERAKREALEKAAAQADLEKRAGELALPGEGAPRVSLLKAVDLLPEAEKAAVLELLKAHADRLGEATKTLGTTETPADGDPIEAIAKRLREQDPNLTEAQSYVKALETPEGIAAYHRS